MDELQQFTTDLFRDAPNNTIVGENRIQAIVYLLHLSGLAPDFYWRYREYGPCSRDLDARIHRAYIFDRLTSTEHKAGWGGQVKTYSLPAPARPINAARAEILALLIPVESPTLILLACAAWELEQNPHLAIRSAVERIKRSFTSEERVAAAIALYERLRALPTPRKLAGPRSAA